MKKNMALVSSRNVKEKKQNHGELNFKRNYPEFIGIRDLFHEEEDDDEEVLQEENFGLFVEEAPVPVPDLMPRNIWRAG